MARELQHANERHADASPDHEAADPGGKCARRKCKLESSGRGDQGTRRQDPTGAEPVGCRAERDLQRHVGIEVER